MKNTLKLNVLLQAQRKLDDLLYKDNRMVNLYNNVEYRTKVQDSIHSYSEGGRSNEGFQNR